MLYKHLKRSLTKIARMGGGITVALIALAGCGNSNAPASIQESATPFSFGSLSGRAAKTNPPVYSNATGVSSIGMTGDISSLLLQTGSVKALERIAYTTVASNGASAIYMVAPTGGTPTLLVNDPSNNIQPSVSPDGYKLTFASDRSGKYQIYVVNTDGTGLKNLTNNTSGNFSPVWSPDGKKIAFATDRDGNSEIYVMNADGSAPTNLTNTPTVSEGDIGWSRRDICWSPDGTKIVYVRIENAATPSEIWVMNANGSNPVNITNNPYIDICPSWSPDGKKIAFTSDRDGGSFGDIYLMNPDGSGVTRLINDKIGDVCPTWSPDGSKLAWNHMDAQIGQVYIMNPDGSGATKVTTGTNYAYTHPFWWGKWRSVSNTNTNLIGTGGQLGASAKGFIYTGQGDTSASVFTFNTADFTTLSMTSPSGTNSTGAWIVYVIEGATTAQTLTALRFLNFADSKPIDITSSAIINGAVVTISALTGRVLNILPYTAANRAASASKVSVERTGHKLTLKYPFLGVWDATGKNIAPHGASSVELDDASQSVMNVH